MKLRCPQPDKARQRGCLDIKEDGQCIRKEWSDFTYFKVKGPDVQAKAEVYCDRVKAILREE